MERNQRIVPLLGLVGIGKSSLARNTLHYLAERKAFTGGILHFQLTGHHDVFSSLKVIIRKIRRFLDLNEEQEKVFMEKTSSQDAILDYLINFFNKNNTEKFKKKKSVNSQMKDSLKNRKFLICLDDVEQVI